VVDLFGGHEGVARVVAGAVPAHPEHRLDFSLTTPGGARCYVGMSISPAPPALRDEVAFIFLFRDLAETIDIETDLKLRQLTAAHDEADAAAPPGPALALAAPADLARAAIRALAERHQADGAFVRLETADDVPEVRLDRQQVTEALTLVLAGVLDACPDPADVRVRLTRTEEPCDPGGPPGPAARIEISCPAVITDRDLGTDPGVTAGRPSRTMDLAAAEKLLEANGGRLVAPARDAGGPVLVILLRATR
jgi:hypothetical protein